MYCIPLSCWEIHNLWRTTIYIGLLRFSPILAIDANGGEVSESLVEKFSEFSPCFGFVPKHLHLIRMHYWLLHCMVMHNSLYKLSWKWLSSITKMGEIERTCGAPMFGFGNWWQSLWTNGCLELYLKVFVHRLFLKSMCWFQGVYELTKVLLRNYPKIGHVSVELIASMSWRRRLCDHSCLPSRHHPNEESWKDSRLIKTKSRVNQVDQLTKSRRCTERDQVIPWYGKHCQLRYVY